MNLATQQQQLADWILSNRSDAPVGVEPPAVSTAKIYRDSVLELHLRSIEADIPVFSALLGADGCRQLLRRYLTWRLTRFGQFNPTGTRSLDDISRDLPNFVAGFTPLAQWPYFADLLRLELLLARSANSAELLPPSAAELAKMAEKIQQEDNAHLIKAPQIAMLCSAYAIDELWDSEQNGSAVDDILSGRRLLIYQQGDSGRIQAVDLATWRLLALISTQPNWLGALRCWSERGWGDPTNALVTALQNGWLRVC